MLNIILFGPPGAGKGTQSQFLREKYNLTYISTGEILREEIAAESELGLQVKEIISQGNLVSDEIVAQIIEKKLSENMDSAGFLFDGYPRTVRQAEILDEMMEKFGMSLTGVLSLEVPEELLIERMLERGKTSGRADDNLDSIKHRFVEYEAKTRPVLDFYEGKDNLHAVNGVGEIPARRRSCVLWQVAAQAEHVLDLCRLERGGFHFDPFAGRGNAREVREGGHAEALHERGDLRRVGLRVA